VASSQPLVDPRGFHADCWQIATILGGRVEDRPSALGGLASFYARVFVLPGGAVTALVNKVHPWVGFCQPMEPGDCSQEFADPGPVVASFTALGRYRVLTRAELEQPVSEPMCTELRHGEMVQLKYWAKLAVCGRLRVGDVVFNIWD
jgi:hypothetical protein